MLWLFAVSSFRLRPCELSILHILRTPMFQLFNLNNEQWTCTCFHTILLFNFCMVYWSTCSPFPFVYIIICFNRMRMMFYWLQHENACDVIQRISISMKGFRCTSLVNADCVQIVDNSILSYNISDCFFSFALNPGLSVFCVLHSTPPLSNRVQSIKKRGVKSTIILDPVNYALESLTIT